MKVFARVLGVVVLASLCTACTTNQWRIADPVPWRVHGAPLEHVQLEKMAVEACPLQRDEMLMPIFVSDGSSHPPSTFQTRY